MYKNTILIVDDEPLNIQVVSEVLSKEYNVKVATNGKDALLIMKEHNPDLVLLDIIMPKMSGLEVAQHIKDDESIRHIPFMFLTVKYDIKSITDAFQAGACDYILKPFIREELLLRVYNHLHLFELQKELHHKVMELEDYKENLELKVQEEMEKRKEKERLLFTQSKLAAMGEMMDAVAHQWKQPISIIKMRTEMLGYDALDTAIDETYIKEFQEKINSQIEHMMSTLDEFRSFFRPNKVKEKFSAEAMVHKVLLLMKDELIKNQISVQVKTDNDFYIYGVENELKHLVINILNNAKEAFNEKNIRGNRLIEINIDSGNGSKKLEVIDNAGGIPKEIISDIFKANFTTKDEEKGTGIGLYMSMQIAIKNHGMLSVENVEGGAKFSFIQTDLPVDTL
jgi:two-component system, sensor histidine kinase and response regulator